MLKRLKFALYIMMYIVIIGLTGILNVVIFEELNWILLLYTTFWTPIIINNTFYFASFIVTTLLVYDVLELRDDDYIGLEKDIISYRDKLVTDDFKQHIINRNFYEKKNVWLQFVNSWLTNLQTKLKHKVALIMKTLPRKQWNKKALKYDEKKGILEEYKTQKWVADNLLFKKYKGWGFLGNIRRLNYPEITVNEIIYGTVKHKEKSSVLERRVVLNQIFAKAIIMVISISMTIVSELLQVKRFVSTIDIIISLAIMLFTILLNVGAGIFGGFRAHRGRVANASIRLGFVVDYEQGKRYEDAPTFEYEMIETDVESEETAVENKELELQTQLE